MARITFADLGGAPAPAPAAVGEPGVEAETAPGGGGGINLSGINQFLDEGWGMLQRIDMIVGKLLPVWDLQQALKKGGGLANMQSISQGGDPQAAAAQPAQAGGDPVKDQLLTILAHIKAERGDISVSELIKLVEGVEDK